jgi:hypothetical protein
MPSRNALARPKSAWYIQPQKMVTTVTGSRNGAKNDIRQSHWPGKPRFVSSANSSGITIIGTVVRIVNHTVFHNVSHAAGSPSAST